VERQKMNFALAFEGAELYAGNDTDSGALTSFAGRSHAVDSIMIGEREGRQSTLLSRRYYFLGRERSVGGG
jgi:hypothetical protein